LRAFFVLGVCLVSIPAAADENKVKPTPTDEQPPHPETGTPAEEGASPGGVPTQPPAPPPPPPPTRKWWEDWHTEISGYFRAPLALGISSRPNPDDQTGPSHNQVSYGPNRTIDAQYYSFAYTRLQEQDWAEVFIHEKHKHVDAAVGWMGYWYQSAGFRNPDAAWVPGLAYLKLDTDVNVGGITPNMALTMGAWWPHFGYFEKYDTYTLGRFRQLGIQGELTIPWSDFAFVITGGFGTGRDGSFQYLAPPFYGATVGADLMGWFNVNFKWSNYVDASWHFNSMWTADPNLTQQSTMDPKSYTQAAAAHLSVTGFDVNLSAPFAGRLWFSPSIISVRNGWALGAGTEVMHSLGGAGIASNYMAFTNSPSDSTGSGTMLNFGLLYENTLSTALGHSPGFMKPEVTLDLFGLATRADLNLPAGSTLPQNGLVNSAIKQFKYGADVTVQVLNWLGFMLRYDFVNLDTDKSGFVYSIITPRVVFSSHFLSGETIYLQYSRYTYGDKIVLNPLWPWNTSLVSGESVLQEGPYSGKRPDEDVVKLQATIAF
jgi:hypothetical protein